MKTGYVHQNDLINTIKKSVEELKNNYKKLDNRLILSKDLYPVKSNTYNNIAQILKIDKSDRKTRALMFLLFKDIYRSEVLSAGSAEVALNFSINFILELLKSDYFDSRTQKEIFEDWDKTMEKFKYLVEKNSSIQTKKDLDDLIKDVCIDKNLYTACKEAINLGGLESKIIINNTKNKKYIVELKNGYNFNLSPYKFFLEKNIWEKRDCKILTVDGFVENVSEIDGLLNACNQTKQPLVIISQGFSEEVVATLYTNFKNGKLKVVPLRLKSDINNLNVINDIGIVCGQDPLSSLKGEMLTFVKLENLPTVEKITISETNTSIENSKTIKDTSKQIQALLNKRNENQFVEDVQTLYEQRIKSLSPILVNINLPDMSTVKSDTYKSRIDVALRTYKSMLAYGSLYEFKLASFLSWDEVSARHCNPKDTNFVETDFDKIFFNVLFKGCFSQGNTPSMSYFLAIYLTSKTILNFLSSSGFVEITDLEEN